VAGSTPTSEAAADPGQLWGAVCANSPDAIVVVDDRGTIVFVNPAVTTLFGYQSEELVGQPVSTLIPSSHRRTHDVHVAHFFSTPASRQMGTGFELSGKRRDGTEFRVDVSLAPVLTSDRAFAAAFVRDATEPSRGVARMRVVNEITRELLAGTSATEVLPTVAARARELFGASAAWIIRPNGRHALEVVAADGPGTSALIGVTISMETSRAARVMRTGQSVVLEHFSSAENIPEEMVSLNIGPALLAPLVDGDRRLGVLVIGRAERAVGFDPLEVAFGELFASAMTASLELGAARADVERLNMVAEEERIARDLHDTVIQQLFAIGMSLQATRRSVTGTVAERIDGAVDGIDDVIREIRNTIFQLPGRSDATSAVRAAMLDVASSFTEPLGFSPRLVFEGPVDVVVPPRIAEHLIQVFGEGLANVIRHARATRVDAIVTADGSWLSLVLIDNGVGVSEDPAAGHGTRNIAARASNLGGTSTIRPGANGGTVLEWRVPLDA
jgi:PAS domain S-box-containing protein